MSRSAGARRTLLEIRYALAVAQLDVRSLRLLRWRKRYDPRQPRVPAGNPDGGQWTGGSGSGQQYAQLAPRRLPTGHRIIGGRAHAVTPAQEARLDVTAAQARALVREVQRRDPTWRPRPSIYEGVEGRILANQSDAQQARARLRELGQSEPQARPLVDVLQPGGQMIGRRKRGADPKVRTVSRADFDALLEQLSVGTNPTQARPGYDGHWFARPDGSIFGVRRSVSHGITMDVIRSNNPKIPNSVKVHKK